MNSALYRSLVFVLGVALVFTGLFAKPLKLFPFPPLHIPTLYLVEVIFIACQIILFSLFIPMGSGMMMGSAADYLLPTPEKGRAVRMLRHFILPTAVCGLFVALFWPLKMNTLIGLVLISFWLIATLACYLTDRHLRRKYAVI